jgi:hypothetical protein
MKLIAITLWLGFSLQCQPPTEFMGRKVTVIPGERDPAEPIFSKGPASVCLEAPPIGQCYTPPKEFGSEPTVAIIQMGRGTPALFFLAVSQGTSGASTHFAVLRPGEKPTLDNLFPSDLEISGQGQYAIWNDSAISDTPVFVTSNYVCGPDESHYSDHRYTISAYVLKSSAMVYALYYYLDDRYMTAKKYARDERVDDILAAEKHGVLARLRRLQR